MSIAEVERELNRVGLCQPALSLLHNAAVRNMKEVKERCHTLADEQRQMFQVSTRPDSQVNCISTIEPCIEEHARQAVCLEADAFTLGFSDLVLKTSLPEEIRPVMRLPSGRFVEIAKAGLDSKGFAHLWSEDGELVLSMPPIQHGCDDHLNSTAMMMKCMHGAYIACNQQCTRPSSMQDIDGSRGAPSDCKHDYSEEFSPSTAAPSSPNDSMDMD
jgi:hypothetical protein